MNEIEVCPECYLAACQKRDNWFCEPCVSWIFFPSFPEPYAWMAGYPRKLSLGGLFNQTWDEIFK